ncbi:MAG TPA: TonB-dependent receptor [Bacteroidia bacterium]|nr:TonB-dependent receptor [Bacteroidia bacterium]
MYIYRLFLLVVCSISSIAIYSQTGTGVLKGSILDKDTKEPIIGATIQLLSDLSKGTASDIEGNYVLVLDTGKHKLLCSYLGLQSDTFSVKIKENEIFQKNIVLKQHAKTLETVVVSSGKFEQKLEELTVSMEVLKPNLIANKNTTSIETALEQVPGLTIIDNDPQIRGGSGFTFGVGSRVAIVVDGVPLLSGDAGRPEWSYIPVENIEQIEVIKGASSVLYGSSALNGVINIRSAYPRSKPKTSINYSAGQYSIPQSPAENWYRTRGNNSFPGFSNLNLFHSRIIKNNLDFVAGANFNIDQGYIGPPPPAKFIPNDLKEALHMEDTVPVFSNNDMIKKRARVNFNLRYRSKRIEGLNFGVNTNFMLNKTNMVFAWLDDSLGLYRGYPGAVFLEDQVLFNVDPFIKYTTKNGLSHSLQTRVFHSDNVISNNQSNKGTMYFGEYQIQKKFKSIDLNFIAGTTGNISYSTSRLYASSGQPDNKIVNTSAYIQFDKKFWRILNLSGGVRYENFKINNLSADDAFIYRFGGNLQLTRGTFVRGSYGTGYRYPTITERYITTKAGMFGVFPNPDLKPETSKSFEVGIKQGFKIGNCKGYVDVAAFHQKYEDNIEYLFGIWDPNVSIVGFKFLNTGKSQVRGIDASIAATTAETNKRFGVSALIGYTYIEPITLTPDSIYGYSKNIDGSVGPALNYKNSSMDTTDNILKYRFKHMFKMDIEFKIYRFNFGISNKYYTKMQNIDKAFEYIEDLTSTNNQFFDVIYATRYWKKHLDISIWDARLSYNIDKKQKLSVVCNNVFNVEYSLRPLKIESPRTAALQYVLTF